VRVLLLTAGSSSLKSTLISAADGSLVASGSAGWAGAVTRYRFRSKPGDEQTEEVEWRGQTAAVERFLADQELKVTAGLPDASREPGDPATVTPPASR
jgi:hypothetical protein